VLWAAILLYRGWVARRTPATSGGSKAMRLILALVMAVATTLGVIGLFGNVAYEFFKSFGPK
jgi:hypothetical protein